jgi:hypothetical protein
MKNELDSLGTFLEKVPQKSVKKELALWHRE